ncbi:hypothetical protein SAMN05192533_11565 [Mesobacillus persicus]|uniref:Uncharacterized protein n=1 Tax=Mesobacillus persicus TaxID=930146 RepID=A0A1H8HLK5_9BACI|nr:hypothetical protein [Mesobacillus persicus]SEN57090.1 hypothetical protein SAMN05192533_11565 [Mesobacillus persicus]
MGLFFNHKRGTKIYQNSNENLKETNQDVYRENFLQSVIKEQQNLNKQFAETASEHAEKNEMYNQVLLDQMNNQDAFLQEMYRKLQAYEETSHSIREQMKVQAEIKTMLDRHDDLQNVFHQTVMERFDQQGSDFKEQINQHDTNISQKMDANKSHLVDHSNHQHTQLMSDVRDLDENFIKAIDKLMVEFQHHDAQSTEHITNLDSKLTEHSAESGRHYQQLGSKMLDHFNQQANHSAEQIKQLGSKITEQLNQQAGQSVQQFGMLDSKITEQLNHQGNQSAEHLNQLDSKITEHFNQQADKSAEQTNQLNAKIVEHFNNHENLSTEQLNKLEAKLAEKFEHQDHQFKEHFDKKDTQLLEHVNKLDMNLTERFQHQKKTLTELVDHQNVQNENLERKLDFIKSTIFERAADLSEKLDGHFKKFAEFFSGFISKKHSDKQIELHEKEKKEEKV